MTIRATFDKELQRIQDECLSSFQLLLNSGAIISDIAFIANMSSLGIGYF